MGVWVCDCVSACVCRYVTVLVVGCVGVDVLVYVCWLRQLCGCVSLGVCEVVFCVVCVCVCV